MTKVTTMMYNGSVEMVFDPDAPRYRYIVNDMYAGLENKPVRGVTTLMRDVIHKPDLLMWPMNEALNLLFDQQLADNGKYVYGSAKKALLQPDSSFTKEQLTDALQQSKKAHTRKSDRGKDIGSMVHSGVELFLKNDKTPPVGYAEASEEDRKAVDNAIASFKKWWNFVKGKAIFVERPVYSRAMRYAGTFDLLAQINGKYYMLDIKTTNKSRKAPLGIYAENFLQLGAYSYAFKEETGNNVHDLAVVNVGKDGSLGVCAASDLGFSVDECERAFAFACRLHDWLEKTSKLTQDAKIISHLSPPKVDPADAK